jgi:U3 small nucleolar RNA-associated protein 12
LFSIRDEQKAKKKLKRRLKRIREKGSDQESANAMGGSFSVWREEVGEGGEGMKDTEDMNVDRVLLSDLLDKYEVIKCPQRVRACAFSPSVGKDGSDTLLVSLLNNSMELHKVPFREVDDSTAATTTKSSVVELQGHRSDVRAVAVSADGLRVASCSAEGLKVWNVESGACICSSLCGYGVTLAFAPGGRYVLVGTKDGSLQVHPTFTLPQLGTKLPHELLFIVRCGDTACPDQYRGTEAVDTCTGSTMT